MKGCASKSSLGDNNWIVNSLSCSTAALKIGDRSLAGRTAAPFTFGNVGPSLPNVRAPGIDNFDLSLFKNFHPLENLTIQFHAEAFNAFNRVQFGAPNQVLSSGQFGVISSQANTPRQIQFALKLLF